MSTILLQYLHMKHQQTSQVVRKTVFGRPLTSPMNPCPRSSSTPTRSVHYPAESTSETHVPNQRPVFHLTTSLKCNSQKKENKQRKHTYKTHQEIHQYSYALFLRITVFSISLLSTVCVAQGHGSLVLVTNMTAGEQQ